MSIFNRFPVKNLCLYGIDLIKRIRGNPESASAQFILNITGSMEDNIAFSKDHAGILTVDIQNDRGNLRIFLPERLYKVVF